jgi:hypothetical protein
MTGKRPVAFFTTVPVLQVRLKYISAFESGMFKRTVFSGEF